MNKLIMLLSHVAVAMLLGLIVLIILDGHNPLMAFLTSPVSKLYMIIMCICGVCSILLLQWEHSR